MEKPLTKFQKQVILLIGSRPGIRATILAEKLWPDNVMHRRRKNGGNGSQRGKGAWLAAGSQVGRLQKKGWVRDKLVDFWDRKQKKLMYEYDGYELTKEGEKLYLSIIDEQVKSLQEKQ